MAHTAQKIREDGIVRTARSRRRSALLASCSASAAALMLALMPSPAKAQVAIGTAVQGTGDVTSGSATIVQTDDIDTVSVNSTQVVVEWDLYDDAVGGGAIDYLPQGKTLLFTGGTNFTVLNRIIPTDATRGIRIDGTVQSLVGGNTGGNVWFYSPGGIIAGSTSVFDVGGLVLTTNNIDITGGLTGPGGEIRFRGAADSLSSVVIEQNAQINALVNGSYVALVAPRVEQGGNVNVNGSVAYVGAEQADIIINNGLFDINIGVGTTDANGVVHSGQTGGPARSPVSANPQIPGSGNPDFQNIYMVTVPKNDAITMLVSGDIGYSPAVQASEENGNIVLSAGYNVASDTNPFGTGFSIATDPVNPISANVDLSAVTLRASTTISASDTVSVIATGDRFVRVNDPDFDLNVTAANEINYGGVQGGSIIAEGDVDLRAGSSATGGTINIFSDRNTTNSDAIGRVSIGGNLTADVSAAGADDFFIIRNNGGTGIGEDAVAGSINLDVTDGGRFSVGGTTVLDTSAQGGKGETQNGFAQAGDITVNLSGANSQITLGNANFFNASAASAQSGKIGGNGPGLVGSDSSAGDITFNLAGGTFAAGNITASISANASSGSDETTAQSNDAMAGDFALNASGGVHDIAGLSVNSLASSGGSSFDDMGNRILGLVNQASNTITILNDGTLLNITNDIFIDTGAGGRSLDGSRGEAVSIIVRDTGLNGGLVLGDDIFIDVSSSGTSDTGIFESGSIGITVDNGRFQLDDLFINNDINSFASGSNQAGGITLSAVNGASISGDILSLSANANSNNGGFGTGGNIVVEADESTIQFTGSVRVAANGRGSGTVGGGGGRGGNIQFSLSGAGGNMLFGRIFADADGAVFFDEEGGFGSFSGDGGSGEGGNITIDLLGGTFSANNVTLGVDAFAGDGGNLPGGPGIGGVSALAAGPAASSMKAGRGGDATGGNIVFNLDGANVTMNELTVSANALGGQGGQGSAANGTSGGDGGDGIGGTATFNAISGTLDVNTLTVEALGNAQRFTSFISRGGGGGFGNGAEGGDGGNGIGGTATFNLDGTSTVNAQTVLVSTDGFGGFGGSTGQTFGQTPIDGGNAGSGGDATGGNAIFNNTTGTISFGDLTVQSLGLGGDGGDNFGNTTGDATSDGGTGGTGTGGSAIINLNQEDLTNPVYTVDASATGGDGGSGLNSGNGGDAVGGLAALNVNNVRVDLDDPTIVSNGTGGNGGFVDGEVGTGGNGGNGTGGTARLEVTGPNGGVDINFIIIDSDGFGGQGAAGGDDFSFSNDGGTGGRGGDGTGGSSEIVSRTGGVILLTPDVFDFTSTGFGGDGGQGGYSYNQAGGDGGDGGDAMGGNTLFLAQGGTIVGNDVDITVTGNAGAGGQGGNTGIGTAGIAGTAGVGSGGSAAIEVQEGSPGIINLDAVTIDASATGGTAGRIEITDSSTDPAGIITFGNLTATAIGLNDPNFSGFYATGDSGPITVGGNATVNVSGNIEFDFANDGRFDVLGNIDLDSGADILVSHLDNTGVASISSGGFFDAVAQGDFLSLDGSVIVAGGTARVRAEQNATVADIAGVGSVNISARQDATLHNGAVTGTAVVINVGAGSIVAGPILRIDAGFDPGVTSGPSYDPNFNALVTGTVTSTGSIAVNAGGNATFQAGSNTVSDNGLAVATGDDIIIESGASLTAAADPATSPNPANPFINFNNLVLQAGGITDLVSTPLTPIASIVSGGDLNANNFAVVMFAEAIDGLGGSISAGSIAADVVNAPPNGVTQSDDSGLLSASCLQGNICLGELMADNIVSIGQFGLPIEVRIEGGDVSADTILVSARRDLVIGLEGTPSSFTGGTEILVESTEGNIDLRDATLSSGLLQLSAATGSLLGTGNLNSVNDIGITIAADVSAASIDTGGEITTVANIGGAPEGQFVVPGSFTVGDVSVGTGDLNIFAGGDILIGSAAVAGTDIILDAGGDASLDFTDSGENLDIVAVNITVGDVSANSAVTLTANQQLSGTSVSGSTVDLVSDNGAIDIFGVSGSSITAMAATSASFGDIQGGDLFVDAGDISITNADIGNGDLTAAGSVTLGTMTGNMLTIDAQLFDVTFGTISAGSTLDITAGRDIGFASASGSGDIFMTAGGGINGGDLDAAGTLSLDGGNIVIGTASGNMIDFTSGTNILFDAISSPNAIMLTALNGTIGANTGNGDIDSDGDVDLVAQTIAVGDVASGGSVGATATTGDASFGTVDAVNNITVNAAGTPTLANAISGGDTSITGASVTFNNGTVGGNLSLNATAGDVDGNGAVSVAGGIDIDATDSVDFGNLAANGGDFTVDAGGAIGFGSASGSGDVIITADGGINGGDLDAAGTLSLDGGNIVIGTASGNMIDFTSGTNILFNAISSPNAIMLTALNGTIGANAGNGDIESDGDIDLVARTIAVGDVTSGGSVGATANTGDASFGTVDATNDITISAAGTPTLTNAISGGDTSITGASVTFNNGTIGGNLSLNATAGDVDGNGSVSVAGGIDIDATGSASFGDLAANGGNFTVDAANGISFGNASASQDVEMNSDGIVGGMSVTSGADIRLSGADISIGALDAGGNISASAANDAVFGDIQGGNLDITALDIDVGSANIADGDLNADNSVVLGTVSGDALTITSGAGGVAFDMIDASARLAIDANGGSVTGTSASAGASSEIIANTGISVDTLLVTGDLDLVAADGAITVGTDLQVSGSVLAIGDAILINGSSGLTFGDARANDGDIDIVVAGDLLMDETESVGDINLTSTGGSITLGQTDAGDRNGGQNGAGINSSGTSAGTPGPGDIVLNAAVDINLNSDVLAANLLTLTAGNNITIDALSSGLVIDATSSDIILNDGAQLGESNYTTGITFRNGNDLPMIIGGDDTSDGYSLNNGEFSQVFSGGDINFVSSAASRQGPDLIIRNLDAVVGSGNNVINDGNVGQGGSIFFDGGDMARVEGNAALSNAGSDNGIFVDAGQSIMVDAENGSIGIFDSDGGLAGQIGLTAPQIAALTSLAADDIDGLDAAGIDERLGMNDGISRDADIFAADAIVFNVTESLLIQNIAGSAEFDDRRGYRVGPGGVTVNLDTSGSDTVIVINGVTLDANGNTVTGIDVIGLTDIVSNATGSGFDQGSTINGCLIVNPASCAVVITPPTPETPNLDTFVRDVIEEEVEEQEEQEREEGSAGAGMGGPLIEMKDFDEFGNKPLIDEPVTGAGNDDLWIPPALSIEDADPDDTE